MGPPTGRPFTGKAPYREARPLREGPVRGGAVLARRVGSQESSLQGGFLWEGGPYREGPYGLRGPSPLQEARDPYGKGLFRGGALLTGRLRLGPYEIFGANDHWGPLRENPLRGRLLMGRLGPLTGRGGPYGKVLLWGWPLTGKLVGRPCCDRRPWWGP